MNETYNKVILGLKSLAIPENLPGMARFGINTSKALGIPMPVLRKYARNWRKNHALAVDLWKSGIHEAMIMAAIIDDPGQVTERQMEAWVQDFDSWDVCVQVCGNLFKYTPFAFDKALEWSHAREEFVKRAGFVMMAVLALKTIKANDVQYEPFFERITCECDDDRNFVKKAVNWALRQIGKRNETLKYRAIAVAEQVIQNQSRSARWIAGDALRELRSKENI